MANTMTFALGNEPGFQFGVFLFNVVLDLIAQVPYYKNKFTDTRIAQLVNSNAEDSFAGKGYKCLWLCIRMWSQFCACTCYGNDCFHLKNICFSAIPSATRRREHSCLFSLTDPFFFLGR